MICTGEEKKEAKGESFLEIEKKETGVRKCYKRDAEKADSRHHIDTNVPVQLWRSNEILTSFIRGEKMTWTDDVLPRCHYATLASTSVIKASMSTASDQAAKSCVAMVTAVLAGHLTRDRLLMSLLLKGNATHSQALSATQLFVRGSSK